MYGAMYIFNSIVGVGVGADIEFIYVQSFIDYDSFLIRSCSFILNLQRSLGNSRTYSRIPIKPTLNTSNTREFLPTNDSVYDRHFLC